MNYCINTELQKVAILLPSDVEVQIQRVGKFKTSLSLNDNISNYFQIYEHLENYNTFSFQSII